MGTYRRAAVFVLWLLALLGVGCRDDGVLAITDWQLVIDGAARPLQLPAHPELPDEASTYVLRSTVALPAALRGVRLRLVIADLKAIVTLRADGVGIHHDDVRGTRYRTRGPHEWIVPEHLTADGSLELELSVAHRWAQSSWLDNVPELLPAAAMSSSATLVTVFNLYVAFAALIALTQLALTGFAIYLVQRRRKVYLWLALHSFAAAYFPAFVLGWTQPVFGTYDAPLLSVALIAAIMVSVHFTHALLDLPAPSRRWLVVAGAGALEGFVVFDPFVATHVTGPVTLGILAILMGYQLFVTGRAALRGSDRWMGRFLFVSWVMLSASMPTEVVYWLGLGSPSRGAAIPSLGLLLFAVGLSLQLGRRHLLSLEREGELRLVANERLQALQLLNQELRRQIEDRSTQLLTRLAKAGEERAASEIGIGEQVHRRYQVVRELGRGGMGIVYEVSRLTDGKRFAMKVTRDVDGISFARLAREALVASRVDHPNVVAVVDVDVSATGVLFVVMELVHGTSLRAFEHCYTKREWAYDVLGQLVAGLAALHAAGIVHRDLKPANLLVTEIDGAPHVKITDFGVSRPLPGTISVAGARAASVTSPPPLRGDTDPDGPDEITGEMTMPDSPRAVTVGITQAGALVGTPNYMAPEVIVGTSTISTTADVFAFGVIAWEVLAGYSPFPRPLMQCLLDDAPLEAAPSLASRWLGPPEVVAMIDRCLSFEPTKRPTADQLAALFAWARSTLSATASEAS